MSNDEDAKHSYWNWRARPRNPKDPTEPDLFLTSKEQADDYSVMRGLYNDMLYSEVEKAYPNEPVTDMRIYEMHKRKSPLYTLDHVKNILPHGFPLLDSLQIDQEFTKSWTQPPMSGDHHESTGFSYATISVVHFDKKYFQDGVRIFDAIVKEAKEFRLNVKPVPFSVETIRIPRTAYRELVKRKNDQQTVTIRCPSELKDEEKIDVPAKIVINAGKSFAMIINLGFQDVTPPGSTEKKFTFRYTQIPDDIVDFLKDLPLLYSVDAQHQISTLLGVLADLYDLELKLKAFDLGALAVAAGCKMDDFSLFSLRVICTGMPFPTISNSMDQGWAKDYQELTNDFLHYLISKVKILFETYLTLMGLLLRNVFPDPDIVVTATEMTQISFISWFGEFVGTALCGAKLTTKIYQEETRADMILSLDCDGRMWTVLSDIIENVPVINCGGARYLHHSRGIFFNQYYALKRVALPFYGNEIPNLLRDLDSHKYKLLYERDYADDSGTPAMCTGLLPNPVYKRSIYKLDVHNDDLLNPRPQKQRPICSAILEWGRLNHHKIPKVLSVIRNSSTIDIAKFWVVKIRVYEGLSNIYYNLTGDREIVQDLEKYIALRKEHVVTSYNEVEAKRILELQKLRTDSLNQKQRSGSNQNVGIHQAVHEVVPGNFNNRNREWSETRKARLARVKAQKGDSFVTKREIRRVKRLSELQEAPPKTQPSCEPSSGRPSLLEPSDFQSQRITLSAYDEIYPEHRRFSNKEDVLEYRRLLDSKKEERLRDLRHKLSKRY